MKQSATIESEMMFFVNSMTGSKYYNEHSSLPGKHVIKNIMNYARSLQVLKSKDGDPIIVVGNWKDFWGQKEVDVIMWTNHWQ